MLDARIARRQVLVRRVAVGAHGHRRPAERGRLAVEAVTERLEAFLVATAAIGRDVLAHRGRRRVLHAVLVDVAIDADRAVLAVLPEQAVRARLPLLEHGRGGTRRRSRATSGGRSWPCRRRAGRCCARRGNRCRKATPRSGPT